MKNKKLRGFIIAIVVIGIIMIVSVFQSKRIKSDEYLPAESLEYTQVISDSDENVETHTFIPND